MTERITYVLDTSVLLSDPKALTKFDEHDVVLPVVVVRELEAKRSHPELGWAARTVLRHLEQLRVTAGSVLEPVEVNDEGGTVRIELNHQDEGVVPEALRGKANDDRILTVACNLKEQDGLDVVLVSKDLPLRIIGSLADLKVEDYRNNQAQETNYSGLVGPHTIDDGALQKIFDADRDGVLIGDVAPDLEMPPVNAGIIFHGAGGGSALVRLHADERVRPVLDKRLGNARGNSAEQKLLIELLDDPTVQIVSGGGPAGTGKTYLAMQAALASYERGDHDRIIVLRSLQEVGQEKVGFMPGDLSEKMAEPSAAVLDALEAATGNQQRAKQLIDNKTVQVLPVTHLRGRTITGTYMVVDEAQNHEVRTLLTVLSRAGGPGNRGARCATKVVLTHDVAQRDSLRVGRFDGVAAVVSKLVNAGLSEFGHVSLSKPERSRVAEIATTLLDDGS